jgi:hypothetical protein
VAALALALWGAAAAAALPRLGAQAYRLGLVDLTDGGAHMSNLSLLWMGVLLYFSVKVCGRGRRSSTAWHARARAARLALRALLLRRRPLYTCVEARHRAPARPPRAPTHTHMRRAW